MKKCKHWSQQERALRTPCPLVPVEPNVLNWLSTAENLIPRLIKLSHGIKVIVVDFVIMYCALYSEAHRVLG